MHTFYKGFVFLFLFKIDCSAVSDSFAIPWTVARQAPLSLEFSRQEYWSGLPFPSPEDPPNPLAGRFFTI